MKPEDELLEVGDRVRLSELGESRTLRAAVKTGKVVGFGHSDTRVRVRFDGRSQPITLHRSYLVKDE